MKRMKSHLEPELTVGGGEVELGRPLVDPIQPFLGIVREFVCHK